jgi:hypothetical protein
MQIEQLEICLRMSSSGRRRSRKQKSSQFPQAKRVFGIVSTVALAVVPIYALFIMVHHFIGGFAWPMLSPYFWALWFVIALGLTIARAPSEELRDDPGAKTGFALGAVNVITAFVAILFSAS